VRFIDKYQCPWWKNKSTNGVVDVGKYDFDHIIEYSLGGSNDITNISLICLSCHREKTNNFKKYKAERKKLNTEIRILQIKCEQLNEKFNAKDDLNSKCDKMIDSRYDISINYFDKNDILKLKLDIEKERTLRMIIKREISVHKKGHPNINQEFYDPNIYQEFYDMFIEKTNSRNDIIDWKELKSEFEKWHSIKYNDSSLNSKDIKLYFSDHIFKC